MDLIIRNAKLRDRDKTCDIGIEDGKFKLIGENINQKAKEEIDALGNLVSPPFVESHVHLDSALTAGDPRGNESGTLLEGIEIWGEYKENITKEKIKKNARETVKWLIANGILKIRTHADSTEPNLITLKALLEVKEEMKDYVDIEIVAFPQDGIFTLNKGDKLLEEALKLGADAIGGLPQVEFTREDGIRSIDFAFNLAKKYNKLIDMHTDETGDTQSRFTEVIAKYALESGMKNKVTASHTTAMHNYDNDYAAKLISLLKRSKVNIVTNPFSNSMLQNRLDGYPRKRGHTRVDELLEGGVNVSIGSDNIMDPFNPLGCGSMLSAIKFLAHTGHLSGNDDMLNLFDMITKNASITFNESDYGIKEGNKADFIILDAKDEKEAIRLSSECLYVIRNGKILVKTKPAVRNLKLNNENFMIDFK